MVTTIIPQPPRQITPATGLFMFSTWDDIDNQITAAANGQHFDIHAWRFVGSTFWHLDLCAIPYGAQVEVKWGIIQ